MEKRVEVILSLELPYRETLKLQRTVYAGGSGPRVAITAGLHGDELEGLYVCHRLAAWLEHLAKTHPRALRGQVELYPGLNPLGLNSLQRTVPGFDSDLNRSFPGYPDGLLPQRIAAATVSRLQGSALVVDVHAGSMYLRELPQTRIAQAYSDVLLPLARRMNLDVIWIQSEAVTALEITLANSLNQRGVPCLLVEMGAGNSVTPAFSEQLLTGLLSIWQELGVLDAGLDLSEPSHSPMIVNDDQVYHLNAITSGMFVPLLGNGASVAADQPMGYIVSPFEGSSLAEVCSPVAGKLLTLRQYPLVYEGSLLARIAEISGVENGP